MTTQRKFLRITKHSRSKMGTTMADDVRSGRVKTEEKDRASIKRSFVSRSRHNRASSLDTRIKSVHVVFIEWQDGVCQNSHRNFACWETCVMMWPSYGGIYGRIYDPTWKLLVVGRFWYVLIVRSSPGFSLLTSEQIGGGKSVRRAHAITAVVEATNIDLTRDAWFWNGNTRVCRQREHI